MSRKKKGNERFKVGDWVSFLYGTGNLVAQVIEARGPLGINRRPLYRILVSREPDEPDSFEMPEDEMEPASPPDKAAVIKYLTHGGLVAILQSNLRREREQPKAWLTYRPRGGVTHTFAAERGVIGGSIVPYFALHEDKVFAGKQDEVIAFLGGFGLARTEAEDVVAAVGTAP